MKNIKEQKVLVGLSGGVDSAVALYLLKKEGYRVAGAFIKGWYPKTLVCDWRKEREDAKRVALLLGVPFITLDLSKEYKKYVVDYLFQNYTKGLTPNPDIMCNKFIKFGSFWREAQKRGFNYIATGHYVKKKKDEKGEWGLWQAKDKNKDQSYFLWVIKPTLLENILFPLGDITKKEVRKIARELKLPVAEKRDSVGICFIGEMDMKAFLLQKIKPKPGKIVSLAGEVVGEHLGLPFYTTLQRVSLAGQKESYHVVAKDPAKNLLFVAPKSKLKEIGVTSLVLHNINLLVKKLPDKVEVVLRYQGERIEAKILEQKKKTLTLKLAQKNLPVPGQFGVLYHKERLLGGGEIGREVWSAIMKEIQ